MENPKNLKYDFSFDQHIPHLSCKYDNFCMQNTKEIITKYVVDANVFRLGSTNPKKL